jgi:HSP20 family molecular chaperone IbpA
MSRLKSSAGVPLHPLMVASSFPAVRLSETPEHVTVVALVPGFGDGDLDITLVKDVLCISGRHTSGAPRDFRAVHQGRRATEFRTEIKLLSDVIWSDTAATLARGVLTVRLRKDVPTSRSLIPIRHT